MASIETVNQEFEVGFNQAFETKWYYAELAGRCLMVLFLVSAMIGLLGRGPLSYARATSADGTLQIDYEPIARQSAPSMITVHIRDRQTKPHPVLLQVNRRMVDPWGSSRSYHRRTQAAWTGKACGSATRKT